MKSCPEKRRGCPDSFPILSLSGAARRRGLAIPEEAPVIDAVELVGVSGTRTFLTEEGSSFA